MRRAARRSMAVLVTVAFAAVLAGCSLLPNGGETRSVSDPQNLFHVKIPAAWQASTDSGFLSIYAAKSLPAENEQPDALSVLVFTSSEASSAPVADVVDFLIEARAESRGWKKTTPGTPKDVTLGGRDAYQVDVTAVGADGEEFESRYLFARTGGKEFFVVAIAPRGDEITKFDDELELLTTEWYWHFSESGETSPSADASDTSR